jgi:hypothetical protein
LDAIDALLSAAVGAGAALAARHAGDPRKLLGKLRKKKPLAPEDIALQIAKERDARMARLRSLRDQALAQAQAHVGVQEHGGPNRGEPIESWLREIGLQPGQPWCMAFVIAMYRKAAASVGTVLSVPESGRVATFWRRCPPTWKSDLPSVGAIFCRAEDPDNPASKGHTGFVLAINGNVLTTIEGNTNEAGAREGDGVMKKERRLSYVNLGFVDIARDDDETEPGRGKPTIHG